MSTSRELLDRLDTRHDELIQKLDDLNSRIEKALAEIFKSRAATPREAVVAVAAEAAAHRSTVLDPERSDRRELAEVRRAA